MSGDGGKNAFHIVRNIGAPYLQDLPANIFLQDAVWPTSTFHVGPDQPDPRPNPNQNPNRLWGRLEVGSRSAGAVARVCRVFLVALFRKSRGGRKASLDKSGQRPARSYLQVAPANRAGRVRHCIQNVFRYLPYFLQ